MGVESKRFTAVETVTGIAILAVVLAILLPELQALRVRRHAEAVVNDARSLYAAFKEYRVDHQAYYGEVAPDTLHPLRADGSYAGIVTRLLLDGRIDEFDSPDDQGADQEFWLEMTLARDPSVRILVADSDDAPLGGGVWLDGVYRFADGVLTPL